MVLPLSCALALLVRQRSRMVSRLNSYASDHTDMFRAVVDMISTDFMHIIERQVKRLPYGVSAGDFNFPIVSCRLLLDLRSFDLKMYY